MEYAFLSWNDVRLHKDRLHELCFPLSRLSRMNTDMFGLYCAGHFICLHSRLVTMSDIWAVSAAWMPLVEQDLIYHLESLCLTSVLLGSCCSNFSFLMRTNVYHLFSLSLSLTFVLRYFGSGYTQVVFRLLVCLLGLKLSLYLVCILYFAVICTITRLHQSNQVHSMTWQALLICKYQIPSTFPCCKFQNMKMLSQWYLLYSTILCEMWLWNEGLSYDGQQFLQYQQNKQSPLTLKSLTTIKTRT